MPKLLSQRPAKARRKTPPCGRLIKFVAPHSPFQKLIEGRRVEKNITGRELGRIVSRTIKTSSSTLYMWTHNENGFPHPKAFKPAHITALAAALDLKQAEIELSIDTSRQLYTKRSVPMPLDSKDAFRTFIDSLKNDTRVSLRRSYVLNLAINLYRGATGEDI